MFHGRLGFILLTPPHSLGSLCCPSCRSPFRAPSAFRAGLQRLRDVHVSGAGFRGLRVEPARRSAPLALALHPRLSSSGLIFVRLVVARGGPRAGAGRGAFDAR